MGCHTGEGSSIGSRRDPGPNCPSRTVRKRNAPQGAGNGRTTGKGRKYRPPLRGRGRARKGPSAKPPARGPLRQGLHLRRPATDGRHLHTRSECATVAPATNERERDMNCGICSSPATHYFATVGQGNQGRCYEHAMRFGYPEYLVELNPPKPALRQSGYIINFNDGEGNEDEVAMVWPFAEELAAWWVDNIVGCGETEAEWLISDAIYDSYRPQYLEKASATVEVTHVTCLTLV
ncbi:hypothetical protein SEA_HANK144_78 [Streptomyces phage Hank144]|uniref:Uncharacterized protein n=1 Tax=Streptomyces phage Hank144 TaxID=2301573 RepID=A0A385DR13_9CAUD|nr:hypothetical protein KGG76_gp78 [Streptomyces phage Hank144]AXQ61132.1 hypothetical protein SEA_HANK144_78 [Streptomyces phage Hank144]